MRVIKKKCLFIFILFLLSFSELFAQYEFLYNEEDVYYYEQNGTSRFWFKTSDIVEFYDHGNDIRKTATYSIEHEYNVPFLNLNWDDGTSYRYLMLVNRSIMLLYADNTMPKWDLRSRTSGADGVPPTLVTMGNISASSTLIEGNSNYSATPERLGLHINSAWAVEGGVGERLHITPRGQAADGLEISIGYVHFSQHYLFQYNARPKKIRIIDGEDESIFFDVELLDTPNFQYISYSTRSDEGWWTSRINNRGKVIIEILEVFPGTRYNHMCINGIFSWFSM